MLGNQRGLAHIILILAVLVFASIGGLWAWKKNKLNIIIDSPSTTPSVMLNIKEIPDDWKSYINEEGKFKFKYPPGWTLSEDGDITWLFPPDNLGQNNSGIISISFENINTFISTEQQAITHFQAFMDSCSPSTPTSCTEKVSDNFQFEKQIMVAKMPAFQTYGGCCLDIGRRVFLYHNNNSYTFTLYNTGTNTQHLINEDIYNQLLSSFEFIN